MPPRRFSDLSLPASTCLPTTDCHSAAVPLPQSLLVVRLPDYRSILPFVRSHPVFLPQSIPNGMLYTLEYCKMKLAEAFSADSIIERILWLPVVLPLVLAFAVASAR
jgi:hypothetical protein